MIKILFFDFDGTISDARSLVLKSLIRTLDISGYKIKKSNVKGLIGIKIPKILRKLGISGKKADKIRKDFYDNLIKGVHTLKLCNSVKPLEKLKKKYKMIVISNAESTFIKKSAKRFLFAITG